ncbi:MAG: hypothetical protein KHW62_02425 [Clostridiales bacterium]|nr:hypothetical protein [Clostridiales bacterium]
MKIADRTLCRENMTFSFKEKIEIARQLDKLNVDVIELPAIENSKTDILLVRTISSFAKERVLSVAAGLTTESIENAALSLTAAANPRIRIELPVSPVGMEYICHKKAPKLLSWISEAVSLAKEKCGDVEFCASDATRAEDGFLEEAIKAALDAGASSISVCDSASETLPDEFAAFVSEIMEKFNIRVGVSCNNKNGMATASAILAVRKGADEVKTSVGGEEVPLDTFSQMVKNCGNHYGFDFRIKTTELHRIVRQIEWIAENAKREKSPLSLSKSSDSDFHFDIHDGKDAVISAVSELGYSLSDEDNDAVYEEFLRVAAKKDVGTKELEAIVASVALQVPATYQLCNYIVNTGNVLASSAQITLTKNGETIQGISMGDGPIDAAFLALEQLIGRHFELDDFQIQAVTEGKEAMGSAFIKLRSDGKLYSGNGISTDIIGASIRAYINAVNKIAYEEEV